MRAKTSKEVTDRQKSCQFLLTALRQQGSWVAERLLDLVRPHLLEEDKGRSRPCPRGQPRAAGGR